MLLDPKADSGEVKITNLGVSNEFVTATEQVGQQGVQVGQPGDQVAEFEPLYKEIRSKEHEIIKVLNCGKTSWQSRLELVFLLPLPAAYIPGTELTGQQPPRGASPRVGAPRLI